MAGGTFEVWIQPRLCQCDTPPNVVFVSRSQARAVETCEAHWNLYVGFYGELTHLLHFSVVDTRDGAVIWRDGRQSKEEEKSGSTLF